MKTLELKQMEELQGGECTKTTTKVLMTVASATVGVLTGGIGLIFAAWSMYELADTMASQECEEW
jgi:Na+/glutamate symporter